MEYEAGSAVGAGIIAGAIMIVPLYMGIMMMPKQMTMNLFKILGTMMFDYGAMAYIAGAMIHAGLSIGFGLTHAAFFRLFEIESNFVAWGLLFGAVHWAVVGMAMGMMPMMHPKMRNGEMAIPGPFVIKYPKMTTMGFLMLHLLYGVLVGTFYDAFM